MQAADYYLRTETGISEILELIYKNSKGSDKKYNIKFLSKSDEAAYKVKLKQDKNAVKIIKSCGDRNSYIPQFRLFAYNQSKI